MSGDLAVVNYASEKHSVELRPIDKAVIGSDEVLLEVAAIGVCGSDLHMWLGEQSWPMQYPVVLGHEFSGIVREVGADVAAWTVGERVVSETHAVIDADSPLTRTGLYNLDPGRLGYGAVIDGAMRRFVAVPQRILHRIPDGLSFEKAALTEPCCVAYNATVNNSTIRPGDRVLVLGPGPIGVLCAAIAQLCGAEVGICGLERDTTRLEIARQYGCTPLVGDAEPWAQQGDGYGVDGVIDATGVSVALETALKLVRPAGWITKVGWGPQPLGFNLDPLVQKNVTLQGSFSHNWPVWERILRLLGTGRLNVDPVIGGTWPLDQWASAFETMHSGSIVKAVLKP